MTDLGNIAVGATSGLLIANLLFIIVIIIGGRD